MASYDVDELISTARRRKTQAENADRHNREEAESDLLFRVLKQWDETQLNNRQNPGDGSPPRPCLVVDRLGAFCNQVVNEIIQNEPAPSVIPRGSGATKETARVIEGRVRQMLYDSDAQLAFGEAAKYAVCSGTGHFRMDPEIIDEETNQQAIRVNPIYDPSTVFTDPFAKKPDKTDARWRLVVNVMSRIEFREKWPDAKAVAADFADKDGGEWLDPNGDKESVMVAEYWCVEKIGADDVALGTENEDGGGRKYPKNQTHRVVCHIIDGIEELEDPTERPGKVIPIFTVEGDSFWVKGKRYVMSLIRSPRDNQRLYNWEATKEVELLAMQSVAPYIVTPKMVENHEAQWQDAPNKNYFYLKANADPNAPQGPQRNSVSAPIEAITAAKVAVAQEMKDQIGLQDPNLGRAQSANQSGVAIQKLRQEGDIGTYHYQNNLKRTLKEFCKVYVSWIPYYHDIEQEMVILDGEMNQQRVQVNTPGPVQDPETGQMYQHDLTKGNYEVAVEIAPSYATQREMDADFYAGIVSSVPDAFWIIGDLLVGARDGAGNDEAADRLKRAIALRTPGLIQSGQQGQLPPEVQAQIGQLQQQNAQLTQALQQAGIVLKTKQIETQGRLAVEDKKQQTAIVTTAAKLQAQAHSDVMEHGREMYKEQLRGHLQAAQQLAEMLHDHQMADRQAAVAPPPIEPGAEPAQQPMS